MASFYLCPAVHHTWFVPGGNLPATGAQLFTYVAGSSTKTTVYKNDQGSASHTNPIILDSGGNLPSGSEIWIPTGVTIDVVFAPATDTDPPGSPYFTLEDLSGINDVTASASEWVSGPTPTFVSGTSFTLVGDQTSDFHKGRRLRTTNSGGTIYSTIITSTFGAVTTVVVANDSGVLDSGLSAVSYSLISAVNPSISADMMNRINTSVASAGNGTTNIWGIAGNSAMITGTNTIFGFSTAPYPGAFRSIVFDSALTLATSASLSLPSGMNVTTNAGTRADVLASTTALSIIKYLQLAGPADGTNVTTKANSSSDTVRMYSFAGSTEARAAPRDLGLLTFITSTQLAAPAAQVDITQFDATRFDHYMIQFYGFAPSNDNVAMRVRLSTSGSFITTGTYDYAMTSVNNSSTPATLLTAEASTTYIMISNNAGNATNEVFSGHIWLYGMHASTQTRITYHLGGVTEASLFVSNTGSGHRQIAENNDGVRFTFSAGNVSTMRYSLYGVR